MSAEKGPAAADNPMTKRVILILVGVSLLLGIAFGVYTYISGEKRAAADKAAAEKAERLAAEREAAQPRALEFTGGSEVVSGDRVASLAMGKGDIVESDFNQDGLADAAIVYAVDNGEREVGVYLQEKAPPAAAPKQRTYKKVGTVREFEGCKIQGVASTRQGALVSLLILLGSAGAESQMVEYRNDGKRFLRVDDMKVKTEKSGS